MSWSMPDGAKESDLDVGKVESVEVPFANLEKGSSCGSSTTSWAMPDCSKENDVDVAKEEDLEEWASSISSGESRVRSHSTDSFRMEIPEKKEEAFQ